MAPRTPAPSAYHIPTVRQQIEGTVRVVLGSITDESGRAAVTAELRAALEEGARQAEAIALARPARVVAAPESGRGSTKRPAKRPAWRWV